MRKAQLYAIVILVIVGCGEDAKHDVADAHAAPPDAAPPDASLGHAYKLIGYELGLSISTVATQLASAMRKLGVKSRLELIALARAATSQP